MTETSEKILKKIEQVQTKFEENQKLLNTIQQKAADVMDDQKRLQGEFRVLKELAEDLGYKFDDQGNVVIEKAETNKPSKKN